MWDFSVSECVTSEDFDVISNVRLAYTRVTETDSIEV